MPNSSRPRPLLVRFRQATRRAGGWSLTIRTVVKDVQTTVREWAQDVTSRVGTVDRSTGCAWPSANRFVPRAPAPFVETTVAKREAVIRRECCVIDADVDLGDRVLVLTLRSPEHRPDGDRRVFDQLFAGLRLG